MKSCGSRALTKKGPKGMFWGAGSALYLELSSESKDHQAIY